MGPGYLVFPVHYFDEYDYSRPRNLLELVPITTQEVKPLDGPPVFPLKETYDRYRNFPLSQLPADILRPAEPTDCDEFADKPDSEDPGVGVGGQSPAEPEPGVAEDGVQVAAGGGSTGCRTKGGGRWLPLPARRHW